MHTSKLISLFKSLAPTEIHWLQKFLKSPFYNSHKLPISLFQYIHRYYPELTSSKLEKEVVFKKLFPKEDYDVQKMRKAMHSLAILIEEFLVAMRLRKQAKQKKQLLLNELGDRNLYNQFEKRTKNLVKDLKALPYRNVEIFREIYELNLNYYGHIETAKQKRKVPILSTTKSYLDFYYLLQSQRLQIAVEGNKKLFGSELSIPTLAQSKRALQKEPAFKLYELIKKAMSTSEDDKLYAEIVALFQKEINRLGRNDQLEILRLILNHFSNQINRGKEGYHARMLSFYKFGLEQDLLVEKGLIGENIFTNITTVGLVEKEFNWVEQFIENYTVYLPASIQKDATNLSKGLLFFYKKDYGKTIDLLLNHTFIKPLYLLNAKTILLRTYYEQFEGDQSYYDLLLDQCHAFERFVRRNSSISNTRKALYLNFIAFTRKIANAYLVESPKEELANQLRKTPSVALKSWLLEKLSP